MIKPLLHLENLTVYLRGITPQSSAEIVKQATLSLNSGDALGLVGESGCGKTTVALAIMRLLPEPPLYTTGSIYYKGTDLLSLPAEEMQRFRGREIGLIFQDPMTALNPVKTIGEQIAEVIRLHQKSTQKEAWEKAIDLLARVHIPNPTQRAKDYPHQLSGGLRQRALIATAIAGDPSLLIADEPTTALDVTVQAEIMRLLAELISEHQRAMIFITHDLGLVAGLCDQVAVMYAGEIVEYGPVQKVLESPLHPYTQALLNSLPNWETPPGHRLPTIPGQAPQPAQRPPGCPFHPRCPFAFPSCSQQPPPTIFQDQNHWAKCWLLEEGFTEPFNAGIPPSF